MPLHEEIDASIHPGNDFYRYVNQNWITANPIPDDKASVGAFTELADGNLDRLKELFEGEDEPDSPANTRLVRQFYRTGMDTAAIESTGLSAIQPTLDRIFALGSATEAAGFVSEWHGKGQSVLWSTDLDVDDRDSRHYVLRLSQAGLGLPDREYYTDESESMDKVRSAYTRFLTKLFELIDQPEPEPAAKAVLAFETELALASDTGIQQRDGERAYNVFDVAALTSAAPAFDWSGFLKDLGLGEEPRIIVSQPAFIKRVSTALIETDLAVLRPYLAVQTLLPLMTKLPKAFQELHFDLYGRALSGAKEPEPRERRVINLTQMLLPEPTGQLFVQAHFDESAKEVIHQLVSDITAALGKRIDTLPWMSDATKKRARAKLDTFHPLLGYPDAWRDYSGLEMGDDYAGNVLAVTAFERARDMARIDKPVDRDEWLMSPAAVNAYYWPNTNGITFPAGILQPPFFDASGDAAANYGGIGVVIGHELTHGFDDQGSQFDEVGNLVTWWTPEDRVAFEERAGRLAFYYDNLKVGDRNVNGQLTLGETIADLGGVLTALDALNLHLSREGDNAKVDGFTPVQRFFMAFARIWRVNMRPERAEQLVLTDNHAPNVFRTNATLAHVDAFYEAFGIGPDKAGYIEPAQRIRIW